MNDDEISLKVGKEAAAAAAAAVNKKDALEFINSYVIGMSFENHIPVDEKTTRHAELNLQMQRDKQDPKKAAIEFRVKLSAKTPEGKDCFVLNLNYVGIFIINDDKGDAEKLLSIEGATILYPYLRQVVSQMSNMTYSKMSLSHMDFAAAYAEQKKNSK